jgi:hypothetical protein
LPWPRVGVPGLALVPTYEDVWIWLPKEQESLQRSLCGSLRRPEYPTQNRSVSTGTGRQPQQDNPVQKYRLLLKGTFELSQGLASGYRGHGTISDALRTERRDTNPPDSAL